MIPAKVIENKNVNEEVDEDLKKKVLDSVNLVKNKMNELKVADALEEIFNAYRRCNKYIDETTPWLLAKEETKKEDKKNEEKDTRFIGVPTIGSDEVGTGDYFGPIVVTANLIRTNRRRIYKPRIFFFLFLFFLLRKLQINISVIPRPL